MTKGFCALCDKLFNKHQLVRRTSFVLAWYVVLCLLHGGHPKSLEEAVKLALIGIATGVILWYHKDRGKSQ